MLSQSHSAKAREIIAGVAKGNANPDLQLRAIRYIGIMGGQDNRQILADVYKSSNDAAVKRSILRSFMTSGDKDRLFTAAKSETDASLRGEAIRQLGVMHASSELSQLYTTESSVEIKKSILQSMFVGGDNDKLIELAKNEKDPELRKTAIRNLGLMKRPGTTEALTAIYASDASIEVKKAVINALFIQSNATGARHPGPRREEPRAEEGHRVEAVEHEVEGSDGLSHGVTQMIAELRQGTGCRAPRGSPSLCSVVCVSVSLSPRQRQPRGVSVTPRPRRGPRRRGSIAKCARQSRAPA